jgi:hypothetical protein
MLGTGVGYLPSSIHGNMVRDKAVRTRNCTEGTIVTILNDMESRRLVISYEDSNIEKINGGVTNGNI